uniref:Cytochrome c oxidase subunit 2 n=1 Tax=Sinonovacula constricta TaxID=98310 RepID=I6NHV0_SINCO|nr:cytochrome c oxidase subunit II [Sinonovacula constricta]
MAQWRQWGLADSTCKSMQNLIFYHDTVMTVVVLVLSVVGFFLLLFLLKNYALSGLTSRFISSNERLEAFWAVAPSVILAYLGFSSLLNLYTMEMTGMEPDYVVKVTGRQWYWSYSGSVISTLEEGVDYSFDYDSYMIPEEDLTGELNYAFRLNEVDEALYLPADKKIRLLFGSDDVMHSFYVPGLGIKVDCIPGRVNSAGTDSQVGVYYGKCTEICGAHHSHMPIKVEFMTEPDFLGVIGSFLVEQINEHQSSLVEGEVDKTMESGVSLGLTISSDGESF